MASVKNSQSIVNQKKRTEESDEKVSLKSTAPFQQIQKPKGETARSSASKAKTGSVTKSVKSDSSSQNAKYGSTSKNTGSSGVSKTVKSDSTSKTRKSSSTSNIKLGSTSKTSDSRSSSENTKSGSTAYSRKAKSSASSKETSSDSFAKASTGSSRITPVNKSRNTDTAMRDSSFIQKKTGNAIHQRNNKRTELPQKPTSPIVSWMQGQMELAPADAPAAVHAFVESRRQYRQDTSYKQIQPDWSEEDINAYHSLYAQDPKAAESFAVLVNDANSAAKTAGSRKAIRDAASKDMESGALHTAGSLAASILFSIPEYIDRIAEFVCHSHPYVGDLKPSASDLIFIRSLTWQPDSIIIEPSGEMVIYDQHGVKEKRNISLERDEDYYAKMFGEG